MVEKSGATKAGGKSDGAMGKGRRREGGKEEQKRSRMLEWTKNHLSSLSALYSLQHGEGRRSTEI